MMRLRAGCLGVLSLIVLFLPLAASAHVFKTDGTITALLHVNPVDEPVAGKTAGLSFTFTDSADKFTTPECDCRIIIKDGSRTLVDRPTTTQENWNQRMILVDYTFPYQAEYSVTLTGAPRQTNGFQPFELDYDVRVDQGTLKTTASPLMTFGLLGLAGLAVAAAGYFVYREVTHP